MRREYSLIDLLYHLKDFPIQAPTFQWLVARGHIRLSDPPSKRVLQFRVGQRLFTFGQVEFSLVTGLCFGTYNELEGNEENEFTRLFNKSTTFGMLVKMVTEASKRSKSSLPTRKLVVLYLLHTLVFTKTASGSVCRKMVRLTDVPEDFNAFPWGRIIFDELLKEWSPIITKCNAVAEDDAGGGDASGDDVVETEDEEAKAGTQGGEESSQGVSKKAIQWTINKFPFAIQAWVLESLELEYALVLANRNTQYTTPRIKRWSTIGMNTSSQYTLAKQTIFKSTTDMRQTLAQTVEVVGPAPVSAAHGLEIAVEFKPVEHPTEPIECDQPVKCPLPEPSILNDGRIWKERMTSVSTRVRGDLPVVKEGSQLEPEAAGGNKPRPSPPKRAISPSLSAPEHNLINLLEECNAAQDYNAGYRS